MGTDMKDVKENNKSRPLKAEKREKFMWFAFLKRWVLRLVGLFLLLAFVFFGFVWYTNYSATLAGKGLLYETVDELPHRKAGLVFGCSEKLGTRDNLYFKYRNSETIR